MNGSLSFRLCRLSTRFCSIKPGTLNKINSQITSFYMQVKINQAQKPFPAPFIRRVRKAWTWLGSQNGSWEGDTSRGEEAATLLTGESDIPSCLRVEVENGLCIRHVLLPNGGSVLRSGLICFFPLSLSSLHYLWNETRSCMLFRLVSKDLLFVSAS